MIEYLVATIEHLVTTYGVVGIFTGAFLEEIFAPIPSATVMLSASFAYLGGVEFSLESVSVLVFKIGLPVALGLTIGSLFIYGLSYVFGKPFIDKYGKYFYLSWDEVSKFEKKMEKSRSDEWGLFLLRSIPLVPFAAINALCGLIRWPLSTYLLITFAGAFTRTIIVGILGWQIGSAYKNHVGEIHLIEEFVMISIIVLAIAFIVWHRKKKKDKKKFEKN